MRNLWKRHRVPLVVPGADPQVGSVRGSVCDGKSARGREEAGLALLLVGIAAGYLTGRAIYLVRLERAQEDLCEVNRKLWRMGKDLTAERVDAWLKGS